jgi:ring-1,2-phenylacetyl-CoA epoxidase subunit PaaC
MNPSVEELLEFADDELVLGWRNSEWTGIAPFLEEDVAFSSIAQTEIGHARAWYELAAKELDTDPDSLAFDREPGEYRSAQFVELRLVPDWAATIARHWLYETADAIRIEALKKSEDSRVSSLAEKIDREEAYHRMHAQMWADRLGDDERFRDAVEELWPHAAALLPLDQRSDLATTVSKEIPSNSLLLGKERGQHSDDFAPFWEEMTMVRRSVPGAAW